MAHSHRMPRRKVDLEVEIARLMIALRQARATAEDLREQKAALIEQHHRELLQMRYRVIGEQLGQRILDRVDAEIAALGSALAEVASDTSDAITPDADLVAAMPEVLVSTDITSVTDAATAVASAVSAEDARALEILTAQVADLQQRLTDAQRTIETLVARVLEMASDQLDTARETHASPSVERATSGEAADNEATVHTLRFRLTGSDD